MEGPLYRNIRDIRAVQDARYAMKRLMGTSRRSGHWELLYQLGQCDLVFMMFRPPIKQQIE